MKSLRALEFLRIPFPCTLFGLLAALWWLVTYQDPYIDFASPVMVQLANASLPMLLGVLLWSLSGRVLFAFGMVGLLHVVVLNVNATKTALLNANLVWADLRMIPSVAQAPQLVFGFADVPGQTVAQLVCYALVALAGCFILRGRPRSLSARVGHSVVPALALVGWPNIDASERAVNALHWDMFNQVSNARETGVVGNLLLGGLATSNPLFAAQRKELDAFWSAPEVQQAMAGPYSRYRQEARPDVIVVLDESLFEPALLCGMSDKPVLRRLSRMLPAPQDGLEVPVFGNRTLQTEFEVLSGTPLKFFPKSVFSYYELIKHPIAALPGALREMGYQTHALHPNYPTYWNRNSVYPLMGIDSFHHLSSFIRPDDFSSPWHVSDRRLMEVARAVLKDDEEDRFLFIATIANHGPWDMKPREDFAVPAAKLDEKSRDSLRDYIGRAIDADQAVGWLTEWLAKRKKPTLLIVFGDHMPALGKVFEQLCFKNGLEAEAQRPIIKFWANFPLDKRDIPQQTASFLLPGHALRLAGLPAEGHLLANAMLGAAELQAKAALPDLRNAYSHVAAENLAEVRRVIPPGRKLLDHAAVDTLKRLEIKPQQAGTLQAQGNEVILQAADTQAGELTFALQGAFRGLLARPHVQPLAQADGLEACTPARMNQPWRLTVLADDETLYEARVASQKVHLAQLDLNGRERLTLRWQAPAGAGECNALRLRVTQLECAASRCP